MSVLLVFDKYGIDDSEALAATLQQLQPLREQTDRHLRTAEEGCLRIRLKPEYRLGMADLEQVPPLPRRDLP